MFPEVNGIRNDKMMFFRSQEFQASGGTNQERSRNYFKELPGFCAVYCWDWEPQRAFLERSRSRSGELFLTPKRLSFLASDASTSASCL